LLDHPKAIQQLLGLERRTARGGRDSIDHSPGAHYDLANALAGCAEVGHMRADYDLQALSRGFAAIASGQVFANRTPKASDPEAEQKARESWDRQRLAAYMRACTGQPFY
jgi:hypothetical protein